MRKSVCPLFCRSCWAVQGVGRANAQQTTCFKEEEFDYCAKSATPMPPSRRSNRRSALMSKLSIGELIGEDPKRWMTEWKPMAVGRFVIR